MSIKSSYNKLIEKTKEHLKDHDFDFGIIDVDDVKLKFKKLVKEGGETLKKVSDNKIKKFVKFFESKIKDKKGEYKDVWKN